jgi:DNA-directed RNA polymerase specialized sigma24 family protein
MLVLPAGKGRALIESPSKVDAGEAGDEFRALVGRAQAGDRRAADAALTAVLPRVRAMVQETRTSGDLRDRLESAATWAAWKAIRSFDPRRSPAPKAYVLACARLRVRDVIGKEAARAQELVPLNDGDRDGLEHPDALPDDQLSAGEAQEQLDRATADLDPKDLRIWERYLAGADLETFPKPGHAHRVVETVRGRLVGCRAYSLAWTQPATESEQMSLWEMVSR